MSEMLFKKGRKKRNGTNLGDAQIPLQIAWSWVTTLWSMLKKVMKKVLSFMLCFVHN
jgi:hypothetical protein